MLEGIKFPIKEDMIIHSLEGKKDEAVILKRLGDNDFQALYNNKLCHAIFNPFVNYFYVDDLYGVIQEEYAPDEEYDCEI